LNRLRRCTLDSCPRGARRLMISGPNAMRGASRQAALLLLHILWVFSVVAPCQGSPRRAPRSGTYATIHAVRTLGVLRWSAR
jgi:hypothetical protein